MAKSQIKETLSEKLALLYQHLTHTYHLTHAYQVADVYIPADDEHYGQYLHFVYQPSIFYDDMYGDSHLLKKCEYVSCYYVENDAFIEVATSLDEAVHYLVDNYSTTQLQNLQIFCSGSVR